MIRKSLLVTFDFPPVRGGISSFMLNVVQALPDDSIAVLTENHLESTSYAFPVYRKKLITTSRFIWPRWLPLLWHMYHIVLRSRISVIQVGQILPFGTCALILKKIFRIPYIVYVYGNDLIIMRHSSRKMRQIRHILLNAEKIIGCSHYTKQLAIENGAPADRTMALYPCPTIHPPIGFNQSEIDEFKSAHKLTHKRILITIGNLVLRKGHDQVIKALPEVIKYIPDCMYIICGKGPQFHHLQQTVRFHQLDAYVQFWPQVNHHDLQKLYRSCDVFIMPSRILRDKDGLPIDVEGFGIVYLEANLYGKPVIGGNTGGVPEAIKNGVSGMTVDPEDISSIARAVITILSDERLACRLGEEGRIRAHQKFDWQKESKLLMSVLHEK